MSAQKGRTGLALSAMVALLGLLAPTASAATAEPAWSVQSIPVPSHFVPGEGPAVWVADTENDRVQDWPLSKGVPSFSHSFGSAGSGDGQLDQPSGVAIGSEGEVWVLDRENDRVQKFGIGGEFALRFGSAGNGPGQFSSPEGIAVDATGNVWVADTGNNRIQVFGRQGEFLKQFGTAGTGNGKFSSPKGIAVDATGNVWVADTGNNRIQKFTLNGDFLSKIGGTGAGVGDGKFSAPRGIAVDATGNVWVADTGNNRIQRLNSAAEFQAKFGSAGSGDGQFNEPGSLATDSSGNVWVADTGNNRIQEFNSTGSFLRKFGTGGSGDGQLSAPLGVGLAKQPSRSRYEIFLVNNGGAVSNEGTAITLTDTLPPGLQVTGITLEKKPRGGTFANPSVCDTQVSGGQSTVTCILEGSLAKVFPDEQIRLDIGVQSPPSASGPLENEVSVEGGGAPFVSGGSRNEASAIPAGAGFGEFAASLIGVDGGPFTAAAGHPRAYTQRFAFNMKPAPAGSIVPFVPAGGDLKRIEVELPPGLTGGSYLTANRCSAQQFNSTRGLSVGGPVFTVNECPHSSAVGVIALRQLDGNGQAPLAPIYNLTPPPGMPAQFGFQLLGLPIYIDTELRSESDFGITARVNGIAEAKRVTAAAVTIWGNPASPSHDPMRGYCAETGQMICTPEGATGNPFMRLPSSCAAANPLSTAMLFETWASPTVTEGRSIEPAPDGCGAVPFSPSVKATPTTDAADSPTGLNVDVHIPRAGNEPPEGRSQADLRDTRVTLPEGLLVNPASADGLAGCSEAQIGFKGNQGGRSVFSAAPDECPDASKIAKVEVDTPLVDHPLPGSVFLAQPYENPFNSLLAIYISVQDPQTGVTVKLPGHVQPDPRTGQLSTTVESSPQTPFEDFRLEFFEGSRASLRTPLTCGRHTTTSSLTPYSAPGSGPPATPSDWFEITRSPASGSCPTSVGAAPNSPRLEAGTQNPLAGAYSPFTLHLSREDGTQELKGLNLTFPPGLVGKLAGVEECSDGAIAAARGKTGRQEQGSASCPSGSQVGTVTVGAGAGPNPYYVKGNVYLAGPFEGAPLSLAVITPAVAGPFDLGNVVVRSPLEVNPETTQITSRNELPTILQGIPVDVRSVDVRIDRNQFTLNPTSCEAMAIKGEAISVSGQVAQLENRFQVGGCEGLGFKPGLSLKLKGGTKRAKNPELTATVTYPKGSYANVAFAQVALPHSEFLDQSHIRTICTRVQFAADQCPKGAIYGHARAISPLLAAPLEGPVYLRSSSNPLPDLVADLRGQIHVVLVGRTDSFRAGLRNTFEAVPDAPVSKFVLKLFGGKRGLIVNSTNICKGTHRATVRFTGHNGKSHNFRPKLQPQCKGKKKKSKRQNKHRLNTR